MKTKSKPKKWAKTATPNLLRYVPSGSYYARLRVGGKLIWRSLETDSHTVAKLKLRDVESEERSSLEVEQRVLSRDANFGDALAIFETALEANPELKDGAKLYRRKCIAALLKSWPTLKSARLAKVTKSECETWAGAFAKRYSPTVFNNTLGTLRMVLEIGVRNGIRYENPADEVRRRRVVLKTLTLPSKFQFTDFVQAVVSAGGGKSKDCGRLVQFLAFGGMRKQEASNVVWGDCDFTRRQIHVRISKNGEPRFVPMIPEMETLLQSLKAEISTALTTPDDREPVMAVHECQKAMDRAAEKVGMARITHHDLRHLFATRCIESGVDVPTVSRWLGHKDGGALAMKVYGHLRDHHSQAMAGKVSFS